MSDPPEEARMVPVEFMLGEALRAATDASDLTPPMSLQRPDRYCEHHRCKLIEKQRIVVCVVCEAKIDPVKWLMDHARDWDAIAHWVKRLREERADLEEQVKLKKIELKRLEAKIERRRRRVG